VGGELRTNPCTLARKTLARAEKHHDTVYRTPPNFEERIYPAHKVAALGGALLDAGVPVAEALAGSGISESRLHAPATRISYRQMLTVFRNAHRLSPDPALGLRAGERMRVTAYGMYGYALLSSPSHAAAIDLGIKYHRVMGPVADVAFSRSDHTAAWEYRPLLSLDASEDFYRFVLEFQFSSHRTLYKDLYGPSFEFAGVRAVYAAPAHARLYKRLFKCPVSFGQPKNEVLFDAAWITDPTVYSDPITSAMVSEMCEQSLAEVNRAEGIAAIVHRLLIEHPGRFPDIDTVAAGLSMNTRTLRRRLEAEQTSYRKILAEVRMRLAIEYLRKTDMTTEEIGTRLGYSDAANFRHAFTRWTRKLPSDFRSR
jgi:AraC-like DNA-binding protein